jgi:F0F1-type ATP synthase assembly protein I
MVVCILGGFLGGWALDSYLDTGFVFAVVFLLIGLGGGMIACYRAVMSAIGEDGGRRKPRP